MDWAKHRRREAAAKLHLNPNLQSFLPSCAVIEEASHHDDTHAPALRANLKDGEIAFTTPNGRQAALAPSTRRAGALAGTGSGLVAQLRASFGRSPGRGPG